jgi:hypothetical protein
MQTNYNFEKKDFDESAARTSALASARAVTNGDEIKVLEQKILTLTAEMQRHRILHHDAEAMSLKNQIDILKGKIVNLGTARAWNIEKTRDALLFFNRPFKKALLRRLSEAWLLLEKAKSFDVHEPVHHIIHGRVFKLESNIIPILEFQLAISQEYHVFNDRQESLADLVRRVDDILGKIPKEFTKSKFLLSEFEFLNFKLRFKAESELTQDNYVPLILEPHYIKDALRELEGWAKR